MKQLFTLFIISITIFQATAQLQEDLTTGSHDQFSDEISMLVNKNNELSSFFTGLYDIAEVKDELNDLADDIAEIKSMQYDDASDLETLINAAKSKLVKIELVHSAFEGYKFNTEMLSDDYFDLWNVVFQKKQKVDKLFTKVNVHSSGYAGQNETEFKEIKKKGIYYPCQILYDHYLVLVRNASQCDYSKRIEILEKTEELLSKMQEFALTPNTRDTEKVLKKLVQPEEIEKFLFK
jgi:hypothetical protein